MQLEIESIEEGGTITVSVAGEIDVSNADEMRDAIEAAFEQEPEAIAIDLAEAPYIDSTGIGVLVGAAQRAEESACSFSVENAHRNILRVMSLLGVAEELNARQTGDGE